MMFFHSIGTVAKNTTVGLCFHFAASPTFLSVSPGRCSKTPEHPDFPS